MHVIGESFPSFRVSLVASRRIEFYLWKIFVPLAMIIFMSWCVFWISPAQAGPQIGVAATSMLTLIAYRFALGQMVPNLPYLARLDHFITGASVLVFLALVEVVVTAGLAERGKLEGARRVDRWGRLVFPMLFVGVLVFSFVV